MPADRHPSDHRNTAHTVRVDVATPLPCERHYVTDREAMLAALLVVLGLPRRRLRRPEEYRR
jgi:hypothetical protein